MLTYRQQHSSLSSPVEFFAYDFDTGSALRIRAPGDIFLKSPRHGYLQATSGSSKLNQVSDYDVLSTLRMVSLVMPQVHLSRIPGIPMPKGDSAITNNYGGITLTGTYPNGRRLMELDEYPIPSTVQQRLVHFELNSKGHLVSLLVPETGSNLTFDIAEDCPVDVPYAKSFADGAWVLEKAEINPESDLSLFEPENVVAMARSLAFEAAEAQRDRTTETASSEEGMREIRKRVSDTLDSGLSQSTKRFALILTGLLVIGVGSLAWWKNRS